MTLRDGQRVRLRLIRPDDRERLREGFERLGPESRYARFLIGKSSLSEYELRYLTDLDGINHFALVAGEVLADGSERGLGVARFVRDAEELRVAEPAVAITDDAQGRGLGGIMLQRLTQAAVERDVWRFRCPVLSSNDTIKHALAEIQPDVHQAPGGDGVTFLEIVLPGSAEHTRAQAETDTTAPLDTDTDQTPPVETDAPDLDDTPAPVGALRRLLRQVASQAVQLEHRWRERLSAPDGDEDHEDDEDDDEHIDDVPDTDADSPPAHDAAPTPGDDVAHQGSEATET